MNSVPLAMPQMFLSGPTMRHRLAAAVARSVRCDGNLLSVAGRVLDLSRHSEVCIVSIGKAGATLFDAIDALLPLGLKRRAIVSAPTPPQRVIDVLSIGRRAPATPATAAAPSRAPSPARARSARVPA